MKQSPACRSGDTITIRNLPPTLSTTIDRIRTFRVAETTYRADSNTLDVIPETPTPKVEVMLAQQEASRDFSRIVISGIHHLDPFSGGMR